MTNPTVKEWMSGDPIAVRTDASAWEALCAMSERRVRHLPVVDEENFVVGVLSFDDLRASLAGPLSVTDPPRPELQRQALEWKVSEIMSDPPVTAGEEEGLADASDRMADQRIGCLPVVDDQGRLIGVLSETDALRALAAACRDRT